MKYIFRTMKDMDLHINTNNLNVLHWWVDTYYGTHSDLKSHTGSTIPIGKK